MQEVRPGISRPRPARGGGDRLDRGVNDGASRDFAGRAGCLWAWRGLRSWWRGAGHQVGHVLRACAGRGHTGMGVGTPRVSSTGTRFQHFLQTSAARLSACNVLPNSTWDRARWFRRVSGAHCEAGHAAAAPKPARSGGEGGRPYMALFGGGGREGGLQVYGDRAEIVPLRVADVPS